MELWELRLIEEMHLLVESLALSLDSRNKVKMSQILSDLVILGETTSYLSGQSRENSEVEMSENVQSTILNLIDLWEKEKGISFNEWVNENYKIQMH